MNNSVFRFDVPQNEPVLDYAPGSPERARLEAELSRHAFIENARWCPLRALFAHHRGVLAERRPA